MEDISVTTDPDRKCNTKISGSNFLTITNYLILTIPNVHTEWNTDSFLMETKVLISFILFYKGIIEHVTIATFDHHGDT